VRLAHSRSVIELTPAALTVRIDVVNCEVIPRDFRGAAGMNANAIY